MIPGIVAQASTGASGTPTERWWRVRFPTTNSGSDTMTASNPFVDVRFISMATTSGGTNLVPSNTAIMQSIGSASNAVVDNTSLWNNSGVGPRASDMWAAFKLPTADEINEVKIRNHSVSFYSPFVVIIESSYDGVSWEFEWGEARVTWGSAELKTFNRPAINWSTHTGRDWLYQAYFTTGLNNLGIFEMEMASSIGGADLCTGGTPRSTGNATFPASNLTDNNTGTLCGSTGSISRYHYVGYSFASDVNVEEVRILQTVNGEQAPYGCLCFGAGTPGTFAGPWYIKQEFYGMKNTAGAATTVAHDMRQPRPVDSSAHRYWRVRSYHHGNIGSGTGEVFAAAKLDFRASGSTLIGSGTPISSSEFSAIFQDDYAFDGDTGTAWASNSSYTVYQWLGYDFGSAVLPDEVVLQARNDASAWAQMFQYFAVDYSDDGIMWYKKEAFKVTTIAGALQEQTFVLS